VSARLLTAAEVAQQLQVPPTFVYRLARAGQIPVVQLGRYRRFDQAAIDAWIQEHTQPANPRRHP
jgi:excisionase family DNA binding protein